MFMHLNIDLLGAYKNVGDDMDKHLHRNQHANGVFMEVEQRD
jgi:hypothetical protein